MSPAVDNLDARFSTTTQEADISEGTAFKVAPTSGYNVQLELREQRIGDNEKRPWEFGRAITSFKAPIIVLDGDREVKLGSGIMDVSHENKRDGAGDFDKLSKRYYQLVKALQDIEALPKGDVSSDAVWLAATEYPVNIFVTETFKVPNKETGEWMYVTVRRPEDLPKIKEYKEGGFTGKNYVQSCSKFRQDA